MSENEVDIGGFVKVDVIARLFGVSARRIQQLTQDGILPTTQTPSGRRYDLKPTIQAYIKYLSDKAHGKQANEQEAELKKQKLEAEIALKESQGELHRLKTDIAAGKYISVEEVTLDYAHFFTTFKSFATSLPSRLIGYLSGSLDPMEMRRVERELSTDVQRRLEAFAVAGVTELPKKRNAKTKI